MKKNRKELDLVEIKRIQLELFKYFVNFCDQNNLFYSAAYGTALGAIRHGGYIPWDDDIDVMVLRKDLDFLLKHFSSGKYKIISNEVDSNYFSPLVKIYDDSTILYQSYGQVEKIKIGIYIDIFVLDSLPNDKEKRLIIYKKAEKIRHYWSLSCRSFLKKSSTPLRTIAGFIVSIPFKIIGYKHFAKKYNTFCKNQNGVGCGIILYGEGFAKEPYFDSKEFQIIKTKFEDMSINIIKCYDNYLKSLYNDYLLLPPLNERISKHHYHAYRKE